MFDIEHKSPACGEHGAGLCERLHVAENAFQRRVDYRIALAAAAFHSMPIQYLYDTSAVLDEPRFLKLARREGHARPRRAQHDRQKLLSEAHGRAAHAVLRHQDPSAQTLFDRMEMQTRRRLRRLCEESSRILLCDMTHCPAVLEGGRERGRRDAQKVARNLYAYFGFDAVSVKHERYACGAFVTDRSDLDGGGR